MNLTQLRQVLPACIRSRTVPFLWGLTGVGKSDVIAQIAESMDRELIDLRLAQQEVGDLIGIPDVQGDRTVWKMPEWWPTGERASILFLDEFTRVKDAQVEASVFQLVRDYRMHTHRLPENCAIVAASNPATSKYKVWQMDDEAMIARFAHILIQPTFNEWWDWADDADLPEVVTSFLSANEEMLDHGSDKIELPVEPVRCRRTWTQAGFFYREAVRDEMDSDLIIEMVAGLVGPASANAFAGWLDYEMQMPLTAEQQLEDPKSSVKMMEAMWEGGKMDWTVASLKSLLKWMRKSDAIPDDVRAETVDACISTYAEGLREDVAMGLFKDMMEIPWAKRLVARNSKVVKFLRKLSDIDAE